MRKQIQKRLLLELKYIYQNLKPESNNELIQQLKIIESIFKEEFSENRYQFYAENLNGIILALSQFSQPIDEVTRNEIFNLVRDLLKYVFNELVKEKELKKDIVFLPYKASMWDSLESIWLAAYEDKEHCNAYVIPIPYAERKPDQSVAAWHCEVDQYPKYVPVLDYQKVNLEEMHPDIIFIHNPYDNYNALTSVDSHYYTEALKKCTDKLVYVPYFVAQDVKPGDQDREDNIAHLITTQGVFNADLVVVQSENIRQVYINVLTRYTNQTDRKYWEERIVGIGSPKYDKILTTRKEDVEIPREWLKIIQKSDKSWKKIIFFNTGVSLALKWKEKLLDKIEDNFRIFKEHQNEVALLWRPHPLMSATMAGMLPELQERYEAIVKRYKEEGWGIYDDTSDMNRAIVLSDAYFGDGSSILRLYEVTGKPIIYHSVRTLVKLSDTFKIIHACYEDKQIWCTAFHDPYLYKIDVETRKIERVISILDENEQLDSFINIKIYKNYFIFVKSSSNKLIFMDRENFKKEEYSIPASINLKLRFSQKFANLIIRGDNLYIFGFNYRGIIKFSLLSKQFLIIDDFLNKLQIRNFNEKLCIYHYLEVKDKIFIPIMNSNAVLEFSIKDDSTTVHYVGDEKQRYISGAWDGENIWLVPRDVKNGDIVKWNPQNNDVNTYKDYLPKDKRMLPNIFEKALKIGNDIVIMTAQGINNNIKISLDTEKITSFNDIFNARFHISSKYACLHFDGKNIIYIDGLNLIRYDCESDEAEKIQLNISDTLINSIKESELERLNYIFSPEDNGNSIEFLEQYKLNLNNLIEFLIQN